MNTRVEFGTVRDPGVVEGLQNDHLRRTDRRAYAKAHRSRVPSENPMLAVYGPGPGGMTCKGCVHLFRAFGGARNYPKCELRRVSSSVATDHRVNWPACGKYEAPA